MKAKMNFVITAILLHTYLAVGIGMALIKQKREKQPAKTFRPRPLEKHQPSVQ
jgi:hypothetical protein